MRAAPLLLLLLLPTCLLPRPAPAAAAAAARAYRMLSSDELHAEMRALEAAHPRYVELYSAQHDLADVPSPGDCGPRACVQMYMRVTDESTLPDLDRPEVFLSGALHGNERVGPTATVELVRFLLEARASGTGAPWLTRLLTRRALYVMPTANVLGYYQNRREENGIDPNRDIPYHGADPAQCMQTTAARAVNELWRRHAFQLAITFHAGQASISSNWGGWNHNSPKAAPPDDVAQLALIHRMSTYGGAFHGGGTHYDSGRLNDNVYPVDGGMEDWAYGASWEAGLVGEGCRPATFGGYPAARTQYDDFAIRALNILVETSDQKSPADDSFGMADAVLDARKPGGDGHVPRNVRLGLLLADVVEPYVEWADPVLQGAAEISAAGRTLVLQEGSTGASSSSSSSSSSDPTSASGLPALDGMDVSLQWRVGGAVHVDTTELVLVEWPREQFGGLGCGCVVGHQPALRGVDWDALHPVRIGAATSSSDSNAPWGSNADGRFRTAGTLGGIVATVMDAAVEQRTGSDKGQGDAAPLEFALLARAKVDQSWGATLPAGKSWPGNVAPQSHVVRRRTDATWNKTTADGCHRVKGQLWWYSEAPICLERQVDDTARATHTAAVSKTVHDSAPFVVRVKLSQLVPVPGQEDTTTTGEISILFNPAFAPRGGRHLRELIEATFFDDMTIFRVVPGFVLQWGLSGNVELNKKWGKSIKDDPVVKKNTRGWISYASAGPDTRSTQLFVNLGDNSKLLDGKGFAPVGVVLGDGMDVLDRVYAGYKELPDQSLIDTQGENYLQSQFPKLTRFTEWKIMMDGAPANGGAGADGSCDADALAKVAVTSPPGCDPTTDTPRGDDLSAELSVAVQIGTVLVVVAVVVVAAFYMRRRMQRGGSGVCGWGGVQQRRRGRPRKRSGGRGKKGGRRGLQEGEEVGLSMVELEEEEEDDDEDNLDEDDESDAMVV